jgi:class 3 adenylate cyclase
MAQPGTEHRKLAAIMFTDMVGYSALSQCNEVLALRIVPEGRPKIVPRFNLHLDAMKR